mmetsp:Transcript_25190/g.44920  ORF Transcript_25190/g.44920 Transcript_25190/m.44920 type:complete len:305 (+) Transcript_25190:124-1038(+)
MSTVPPSVLLNHCLLCYWVLAAGLSVSVALGLPLPAVIREMVLVSAARGKTWKSIQLGHWQAIPIWISELHVPQRWFSHFYLVGLAWNTLLAAFYYLTPKETSFGANTHILLLLFELHLLRRAIESTRLSSFSTQARMHLLGYAAGLSYYVATPLTLGLLPIETAGESDRSEAPGGVSARHVMGVLLYTFASYKQSEAHRVLANIRLRSTDPARLGSEQHLLLEYGIPQGGWFNLVSCPHYLAEILLYFGLLLVHGGRGPHVWLLLAWVISNLSIAAKANHAWYHSHFGRAYPATRWAMLPGIL